MTTRPERRYERRDTAANWTAENPILESAEWALETDTRRWKCGDGATAWNSLAYFDAELASKAGFTGTYAPLVDELLIGPEDLLPFTGGPNTTASAMGVPSYAFDDAAAAEFVGRTLWLPAHWENINVLISWGAASATTGDAVFRCDRAAVDPPPRALPSFTTGGNVTSTVPASATNIKEITLLTNVAVDTTKRFVFRLGRLGSNGSDTLVGDAQITEVRLINADA